MQGFKQEVRDGLQSAEFNTKQMTDKFETLVGQTKENKESVRETTEAVAGLKTRSAVHGLRLSELEIKIERLEREKRRNIIVVEGVIEQVDKSSPDIISELFQDLKVDLDLLNCDRVYRRGKEPPKTGEGNGPEVAENNRGRRHEDKPRPTIVGFKVHKDKVKIYKHLKNLKGVERWDRVYVNDDLTELQQTQLRDLRSLSAFASSLGRESTVRACFIWVSGRRYSYEEIGRLAPEITFEKAKTLSFLGGEGIAFQSAHAPLSNLYPCNVIFRGRAFLSSKGALHYTRAVFCDRLVEARDIEFERNAYRVKKIGGAFKHTKEWDAIVEDELLQILVVKFSTNPYCKKALLATANKKLFEATGDRTWACGLPLMKIHELTDPPLGKNRMGKALEKVRDIIRNK